MLACGVDVGSVQTKAVIIDGNIVVHGHGLVHSGANLARASRHALQEALLEADIAEYDITYIMGTGYGRLDIPFAHANVTEPVSHGRGAIFRFPNTRTVLDIGGQDTAAIKIDSQGAVLDFAMNDKCGAGTGRFLQSIAQLLGVSIDAIGEIGLRGSSSFQLANVCSTLAEAEILSNLEQGKPIEDILAAVFQGIANRSAGLLSRIGIEDEVTITGGVSSNRGIIRAIEEKLGRSVNVGIDALYAGALGAAILGLEKATSGA